MVEPSDRFMIERFGKNKGIMKKVILAMMLVVATLGFTGCSAIGMVGGIYTGYDAPFAVTGNEVGTKVGTATTVSVLGLVAVGDGSIDIAAKKGNIKKISHVDVKTTSILGLFTQHKYFVYGE